ncbi:hypothetical protein N658DRAFT_67543 [Parathielavia hyrcaniae]|uniref:Uncharacterized protein n=1 Tax=Parathielavia hyrcaniae TaxID=113614 RepID=A0AAN6T228_9PEZI|nr:hypothetical protein N658DRAFT_67543 [Parathielavia hyrcaniae]
MVTQLLLSGSHTTKSVTATTVETTQKTATSKMASAPVFPYITAPAERKNFLEAINLISLGEQYQPTTTSLNTDSAPNEPQLVEATNFASSLVTLKHPANLNPNHAQQTNLQVETGLKTARFFTFLLRFMIDRPPDIVENKIPYGRRNTRKSNRNSNPDEMTTNLVAYAHTMLATRTTAGGKGIGMGYTPADDDDDDVAGCARAMEPAVMRKAVAGLVSRRRRCRAAGDGLASEGGEVARPSPPAEELISLFEDWLDEWICVDGERERERERKVEAARERVERVWSGESDASDGCASDWSFEWLGERPE